MADEFEVEDLVVRNGWTASWAELRRHATREAVETAVEDGRIERVARGRYALPGVLGEARAAVEQVNGVMSHLSAAIHWGMAVKEPPPQPTVTVPRGRKLRTGRRRGICVAWADLAESEVRGSVTVPLRTVLDCAARYPFAEALVLADSALTRGLVTADELRAAAAATPKGVRQRVVRVAAEADPRSQSALESLVRGYSRDVPGLRLVPQVEVAGYHPDLYAEELGLAVECDSFEFHAKRVDLVRDCERYNRFTLADTALVRFAWEHAMNRPGYVRATLASAAEVRQQALSTDPAGSR